jgi:hypothetical protein
LKTLSRDGSPTIRQPLPYHLGAIPGTIEWSKSMADEGAIQNDHGTFIANGW